MNWSRSLVLIATLVALSPAADAASAETETAFGNTSTVAASDEDKSDATMSDADKRAKAVDCSKQADAKKLHGAARKKFRSACKSGK